MKNLIQYKLTLTMPLDKWRQLNMAKYVKALEARAKRKIKAKRS
jgi:hypothetical protein